MKVFIIALKGHEQSELLANRSLNAALSLGYDANIFYSLTDISNPNCAKSFDFLNSQNVYPVFKPVDPYFNMYKYWTNVNGIRGSFSSHYRLFLECINLDEPIIILEHDGILLNPWKDHQWLDVLSLDWQGSLKRRHLRECQDQYSSVIENSIFRMGFTPQETPGVVSMSCCYAYAVKPQACVKLINEAKTNGWFAIDRFIREPIVSIETIHPKIAEEQPEALQIYTTST